MTSMLDRDRGYVGGYLAVPASTLIGHRVSAALSSLDLGLSSRELLGDCAPHIASTSEVLPSSQTLLSPSISLPWLSRINIVAQPASSSSQAYSTTPPSSASIPLLKESLKVSSFHGEPTRALSTLQPRTPIASLSLPRPPTSPPC